MSVKFAVVLTWVERIATVVLITVPAIRRVVAELTAAKAEATHITSGGNE